MGNTSLTAFMPPFLQCITWTIFWVPAAMGPGEIAQYTKTVSALLAMSWAPRQT